MKIKIKKGKFLTVTEIRTFPFGMVWGLMFSKPLKNNQSVILELGKERFMDIHTFWVFYPIDAVWINSKNEIVQIERNIRPFTYKIRAKNKAIAILETKKNATMNLKKGDKLSLSKPL